MWFVEHISYSTQGTQPSSHKEQPDLSKAEEVVVSSLHDAQSNVCQNVKHFLK